MTLRPCMLLLGAVLLAAGCATQQGGKPDTPASTAVASDLMAVEKTANEAYQRQDWVESEKNFLLLTQKAPGEAEPWFRLGNIYARTHRPDLAIRAYREVVVRNPKHARAWHNMGIVQLQQAKMSFDELTKFADPADPITARSVKLSDGIDSLIGGGGENAP